jgi:hypothetical protein
MTIFLKVLNREGNYESLGEVQAEVVPRRDEMLTIDDVTYFVNRVEWRIVPSREMGRKLVAMLNLAVWR